MKIGAQLYTLRDFCKTREGLEETLKRVSDIGYTSVQLSGVCDYDAGWMHDRLAACGLTADITHFPYRRIVDQTEETIDFHNRMNCRYIGLGSIPDFNKNGCRKDDFDAFVTEISPAAAKIAASGNHKLMFHNHHTEFAKDGGRTYLQLLCEAFPPEQLGITLDTYWVQAGGGDPIKWIRELSGRVHCIHFKDMVYNAEDKAVRMAPIGEGNMNIEGMIAACEDAHVEFGFVELDRCYGRDPFECMKISYYFLRSLGLN